MAKVRRRTWTSKQGETKTAWLVDYTDSRGNRHRKHFFSKKAADVFRVHVEGQMQAGTYRSDAERVTVKELCDSFLEHCSGRHERDERMTRKMLVVYKGHINNHILNADYGLGSRRLSQLTARSIGDLRDSLRGTGVTVPTVRKILATLHSALAYAVSQDWVATNAAHGTKVIGPRDEGSKKIVPPSKSDMLAILELADWELRVKLLFAASTGARAGEQWAARWRDLDLEVGNLQISRRVDAYGVEGPPKSLAGVRTVPMSKQLTAMLKEWKLRSTFKSADDLLFPNGEGNHIGHDNLVKRSFLPLFDKLDEEHRDDPANKPPPRRFNWHALRHFAVSCWIEAGFAPKTVQTFAGHASLQVTMDRYGHLFPSADHKKAMDQIAKGLFAYRPSIPTTASRVEGSDVTSGRGRLTCGKEFE
jgi:integrase